MPPHAGDGRAGQGGNRHVGFGLLVPRQAGAEDGSWERPPRPPPDSMRRCSRSPEGPWVRRSRPQSQSAQGGKEEEASMSCVC